MIGRRTSVRGVGGGRIRGLTLLELVLTLAVLASLTGLIAGLLAGSARWSEEELINRDSLRVDRAVRAMREQWSSVRVLTPLESVPPPAAVAEPRSFAFVTSVPLLRANWPLVRARYVIERDAERSRSGDERWRLVYEETALTDPSGGRRSADADHSAGEERDGRADAEALARAAFGAPTERHVLLEGLTELRFERWAAAAAGDEARGAGRAPTERAARVETWRPFPPAAGDAESGSRVGGVDEEDEGETAVRIIGRDRNGEAFGCVFVVREPSRS